MATVSWRLKAHNQIEIRNTVDLNELAINGMKRDNLNLDRYDLGRLMNVILGKEMDVVWPKNKVEWFGYQYRWELGAENVKFSTVNSYMCFLIASELIDVIDFTAAEIKGEVSREKGVHGWRKRRR
ncbi:hypothetical protein ACFX2C_031478 [Malus domestica]